MSQLELAKAWVAQDPDPNTRAELQALIDQAQTEQLSDRFALGQLMLEVQFSGFRGDFWISGAVLGFPGWFSGRVLGFRGGFLDHV